MTFGNTARREYPNPPIQEGLCRLTLSSPIDWNVATPGLAYSAIKNDYPLAPEAQDQIEASMTNNPQDPKNTLFSLHRGRQRFIFANSEKNRLLILNNTEISVNSLPSYEGWPTLRSRLLKSLEELKPIFGEPSISQVSLRYINRIVIPTGDTFDSDTYFNIPIPTAQQGAGQFANVVLKIESFLPESLTKVAMTFGTLDADSEGKSQFLLDLEFSRALSDVSTQDALKVADELKALENVEFESLITDETRGLFT